MDMPFVISDHALQRFAERQAGVDALTIRRRRRLLAAELKRGARFGEQLGNDELYLLPCGAVAAVKRCRHMRVVKTVITYDQAIATLRLLWGHRPRAA